MELSIYDVIKKSIITTKSVEQYQKLGKVTFEINKLANKLVVRNAVEKIWNVEVESVRTKNVKGRTKSFARKRFKSSDVKIAVVTLKKGYKIDIPGMVEAMHAGNFADVSSAENEKNED